MFSGNTEVVHEVQFEEFTTNAQLQQAVGEWKYHTGVSNSDRYRIANFELYLIIDILMMISLETVTWVIRFGSEYQFLLYSVSLDLFVADYTQIIYSEHV